VQTLNRVASLELKQSGSDSAVTPIDLAGALDDLKIVLEPYCREAEIALHWDIPGKLPPVWADRHRLLQVLLNLTKNSERAFEAAEVKALYFSVAAGEETVAIRVTDTGPGIAAPNKLFQPFQPGAESTGLGLFLSRAFMRSFHGDLRHDPGTPGCSFVIDLLVAGAAEQIIESKVADEANASSVGR
jgi:C4-dicarboxylate-specific signal transduction histidine kinase